MQRKASIAELWRGSAYVQVCMEKLRIANSKQESHSGEEGAGGEADGGQRDFARPPRTMSSRATRRRPLPIILRCASRRSRSATRSRRRSWRRAPNRRNDAVVAVGRVISRFDPREQEIGHGGRDGRCGTAVIGVGKNAREVAGGGGQQRRVEVAVRLCDIPAVLKWISKSEPADLSSR